MEIVVRGIIPKDEIWYGYCSYCKTQAVERCSELKIESDLHRGKYYARCECPVCKQAPPDNIGMLFYRTLEDHIKL